MKRMAIGLAALLIGTAAYAQTSTSPGTSSGSSSGSSMNTGTSDRSGASSRSDANVGASTRSETNVGTSSRTGVGVGVNTESRREGVSVHSRTTEHPSVSVTRRRSVEVSDDAPTTVRKVTKKKKYVSRGKPTRKVVVRGRSRVVEEPSSVSVRRTSVHRTGGVAVENRGVSSTRTGVSVSTGTRERSTTGVSTGTRERATTTGSTSRSGDTSTSGGSGASVGTSGSGGGSTSGTSGTSGSTGGSRQ
jgi:hypothetical protein